MAKRTRKPTDPIPADGFKKALNDLVKDANKPHPHNPNFKNHRNPPARVNFK